MAWGTFDFGGFPATRGRLPRLPSERGRRRDESLFHPRAPAGWKHVDLVLLACAVAVSVLGALMILSSTRGTNPDGAAAAWQQVVTLAPDSPEGQAAKKALEGLRSAHPPAAGSGRTSRWARARRRRRSGSGRAA